MNSRGAHPWRKTYQGLLITFGFFYIILALGPPAWAQDNLAASDWRAYRLSQYASAKWDSLVKEGIEAYHAENYDVAQKALYKAFNQGCESPIVLFMLALLNEYKRSFYSALEYYQMAQKGFKRANQDHRFNKEFLENYGRALYYSGKKNEALPLLKKAGRHSKSFWLLKLLGQLSYEQGDTLGAVSYFERAVRVKDKDVTRQELVYIYTLLGRLFLAKGEQDGAMRYYQKVLELDQNNQEAADYLRQMQRIYQQKKMIEVIDSIKEM